MAAVSSDAVVMPSGLPVILTPLFFLLHCCASNHMGRCEFEKDLSGIGDVVLEMHAAPAYLECAAGAGLTETGDAVQIVGIDGLILLPGEAECREVEASLFCLTPFSSIVAVASVEHLLIKGERHKWPIIKTHAGIALKIEDQSSLWIYQLHVISWKRPQTTDVCKALNVKAVQRDRTYYQALKER